MMRIHNADQNNSWLKRPVSAGGFQRWLIDNGSLTLRLQQRHPNFQVQPLGMQLAKPLYDEKVLLNLKSDQQALLRRVVLMSNHQPVVYAHSVLPNASLRGDWRGFGRLGNKPLGAALFANPKVVRTPLRFKKLSKHHFLYQQAIEHIKHPPSFLWARRSIFSLQGVNILVTEIFLPKILEK